MKQNNTPIALLVIYEPGFKFKYKKYYIRKGSNSIGSDDSRQVVIQGTNVPNLAAKIEVTQQLATIEGFGANCLHVLSNIRKKNNLMVQLSPGTKYVIEMEKDFLICGRKALMQTLSLSQLVLVKGVTNQKLFDVTNKNKNSLNNSQISNSISNNKKQAQNNDQVNQLPIQFEATVPLQQYNFQPTIPLDNTLDYFAATQIIHDQNLEQYQPTLPLNQTYNQGQYNNPSIKSSKINKQFIASIKSNNNMREVQPPSLNSDKFQQRFPITFTKQNNQKPIQTNLVQKKGSELEMSISMPQTIKQDQQMPATIKQDDQQNNHNNHMANSMFPPTIQQSYEQRIQQLKKKTTNLTKSEPVYRQIQRQKASKNTSNFDERQNEIPQIDSFDDLFVGVSSNPPSLLNSSKTVSLSQKQNNNKQSHPLIKQTHSEHASQKTQKLQSESEEPKPNRRTQNAINMRQKRSSKTQNNKNKLTSITEVQQDYSQNQTNKKCYIIGEPKQRDIQKLNQKGYNILNLKSIQNQDLQLVLIQGDLKLSKQLLISLIKGKQIKPLNWIHNQSNKIAGKLEGFLWEQIQKRKGKGNIIFSSAYLFYLQQQLQEQFLQPMQLAGAHFASSLQKSRSRQKIYVVIDQNSSQGKQLWEKYKNYKNWTFFKKRMIIESLLMGQQIMQKYKIDQYLL